jgi:hypothetical protein
VTPIKGAWMSISFLSPLHPLNRNIVYDIETDAGWKFQHIPADFLAGEHNGQK